MSSDISKDSKKLDPKSTNEANANGGANESEVPDGVSEDVYRFWKQYGSSIILYVVVAIVAFIGVQVWKSFSASREDGLRQQYSELETTEAKLDFANKHKSHGLAAYAYMEAAKEAYDEEDFDNAETNYSQAADVLKETPLYGVALLGKVTCQAKLGETEAAVEGLELIADDENFASGIRSEAMFKRIVIAIEAGEESVVEEYSSQLSSLDTTGFWIQRLDGIKNYQ